MPILMQHLRHHLHRHCLLCTLPVGKRPPIVRGGHASDHRLIAGMARSYRPLCEVCAAVHKEVRWRCQRCKVAFLGKVLPQSVCCNHCVARPWALSRVAVAFDYMSPLDSLVWRFKTQRQLRLAPPLASLMVAAIQTEKWQLPSSTWVVAIPSRRQAVIQRGFNPAAELARYVAAGLGLPWKPAALVLSKQSNTTQAQKHRSQDQRWQYAQQAFQWCAPTAPTTLLVVDDVITTGSTLHGAALCAQAAGVQQVYGVALARTPWLND